jgi:hypothetical protein
MEYYFQLIDFKSPTLNLDYLQLKKGIAKSPGNERYGKKFYLKGVEKFQLLRFTFLEIARISPSWARTPSTIFGNVSP